VLEKDARNFLERTPYQYINIRRDWSGKGVYGEGGWDETTVLRTRYQRKCRKLGTDSLGGQCRWFTSPRKTQKTMDGRHIRVEWLYLHSAEGDVTRQGSVEKKDNRVVICSHQRSSTMVD